MVEDTFFSLLPSHFGDTERELVEHAYSLAQVAHAGQKRRSGEPYVTHCIEVAKYLANMQLDAAAIAAALLHDIIEDTDLDLYELEQVFGSEVATLIDGVTKLESVPRVKDGTRVPVKIKPGNEEEFLRKTILAMDQDVRVILIKLSDRLHNLRTLDSLSARRQRAIAQETMEIFAPLAYRLGMWELKCELEDLSFPYLWPERYKEITNALTARQQEADAMLAAAVARIETALTEHNIPAEVCAGKPRIYTLSLRMREKNVSLTHIHGLRPIRVIVGDQLSCYTALGITHKLWRPIQKEFHDYIAVPKDNYYQSLHTTVLNEKGDGFLSLHMRTLEMHQHAQHGIVSRWLFRNGKENDAAFERSIEYVHKLLEVGSGVEDAVEYIDTIRADVLKDRIYVVTPKGEVIDLPKGATPIDFAYHIHTDIGNRCCGANIDDRMVSLDYVLQTGDKVEIFTAKRGGPQVDWLNPHLGYVKTRRALARIRQWFRRQDRAGAVALGKRVILRELSRLGLSWMQPEEVAGIFDLNPADLMVAIGIGDINGFDVAKQVLEQENSWRLNLIGADGLTIIIAPCCNPQHAQSIQGHHISEREALIHQAHCPHVADIPTDELIAVRWRRLGEEHYPVPVTVTANDREGLVRDIGTVVAAESINMMGLTMKTVNNIATFHCIVEIVDLDQLIRLLAKIEQLPNVYEAYRQTAAWHPAKQN